MKKTIKYVAIAIGVIVVLAIIVPFLIPTDTYKKFIIKQVESKISAKLEVGSMRIRILPLPGFSLKDVKVTNSSGEFAGEPLVSAGGVKGSVSLMPLFSKTAIVSLNLDKPEVYYSTGKNGKTNIDDLLVSPQPSTEPAPAPAPAKTGSLIISEAFAEDKKPASKIDWKILVSDLEIKDGLARVTKPGEKALEIKHLDFKISDFSPTGNKTNAPLHVAVALFGSNTQNFKVDGKLSLNLNDKTASIKDWKVVVGEAAMTLNANGNYGDTPTGSMSFSMPSATFGQLLAFDPNILAGLPKDVSKDALKKLPVSLKIDAEFKKPNIDVKKFDISLGGSKISGDGNLSIDGKMPADFSVNISPLKVSELKNLIMALAPVGGTSDMSLKLKINGPASEPKSLNVGGNVSAPKVQYQDYEISNLKADFKYGGDKLNLNSLTGDLYGGTLKGSAFLAMKGESSYDSDVSITNVDMSQIPATKALLKGRGAVNVKAGGVGTDAAAIKRNLKATGDVHLANGDIPSLKLGEKIFGSGAWSILAKGNVGLNERGLAELRSLDASCKDFNLTFKITDGVVSTPDVKWQHQKYRVTLKGQMTMDEKLDYNGNFTILKPTTDILFTNQTARAILVNKNGELDVPFDVGGTASNPSVHPDEKYLASLFTKVVTQVLIQKPLQDATKIVPNAADAGKKILQGIFGK